MNGSLQVKGNKYYAVIYIPDENGKAKPKWISTGINTTESERKANKILRELLVEYEHGNRVFFKDILFSEWIKKYLEQVKYSVEFGTWECYNIYAKTHIIPWFEQRQIMLSKITPQNIQDYYLDMLTNGRFDGKGGLSANTIKKHKVIVSGALNDAMKKNYISYNPAERATLPKVERFVGSFYTETEANKLLEVVAGDELQPVIVFALFYGLRRSEILGLKWNAIDCDANTIQINNTVTKVLTTIEKERTKNKKSHRTLPLISEVKDYLLELRKLQDKNRLKLGENYAENDFVCVLPNGRPITPDQLESHFKRILLKNNLRHIRFHDLRHTTATLLLSKGFTLKDIQEWLGHADIGTTANIYAHLEYKQKIGIAENMGNILDISGNL